jgi:mRNA interferase RelE/StbE
LAWAIRFDERASKDLARLDRHIQREILRYLEDRVATADDPEAFGKSLTGPLAGLWRYRVRDHRVVCRIQREQITVLVIAVGHRKDIYDRLP